MEPKFDTKFHAHSLRTLASLETPDSGSGVRVKSSGLAMLRRGAGRGPSAALFKGTIIFFVVPSLRRVCFFAAPVCSLPGSSVRGISQEEYWSGVPFPSPGNLLTLRLNPCLPSLLHCCCCCSVAQSCPPLCNPTDCSTTGFLVFHHLREFAQTHAH